MTEPQIKSGMVTGCKIKHLKMIYRGKSGKTGKKWDSRIEIHNACMEKANFSTQAAVLWHKFTNYEVDNEDVKEAVRCEMELVVWYLIDSYVGMYFCCCLSISTEHYGSGQNFTIIIVSMLCSFAYQLTWFWGFFSAICMAHISVNGY